MRRLTLHAVLAGVWGLGACASSGDGVPRTAQPSDALTPELTLSTCGRLEFGAFSAVCVEFGGAVVIADTSPPRLLAYRGPGDCLEFQAPPDRPAFRPSDASVRGFFVYAVDEPDRLLLRWDSSGGFRDVLLNFDDLDQRRRVSPSALDVDASGRVAITDIENHQVLVLDTYLDIDVAFGNYGAFDGQMDAPLGVCFTPRGDLLVADTGNARLQIFSDAGAHRRTFPAEGAPNPLRAPRRAVMTEDGRVFVADAVAGRVFEFAADGALVRALVPSETVGFRPMDVALAREGLLYVADASSRTLLAFKVM